MSEPTPRGPAPPDPLETLLRATGQEMEYPPTPPLARAVRVRLEREGAAPGRRRWWQRGPLSPQPPLPHKGKGGDGVADVDGAESPRPLIGGVGWGKGSALRWAGPGLAA